MQDIYIYIYLEYINIYIIKITINNNISMLIAWAILKIKRTCAATILIK